MSEERPTDWHDVREMGIEGKGWTETESFYDRLPAKAKGLVPEAVWQRSLCSAGICAHFETDATEIHAEWRLLHTPPTGPHAAATGCSGLDLYALDGDRWRWVYCFQPQGAEAKSAIGGLAPGRRKYRLYMPLRNPLKQARIGVPEGASFSAVPAREGKPIVYYGTSIVHGTAASRPGMCHANILGRRLGKPMINLGFGGQGKMHPEIGDLLVELDPLVYLVDCLPNMPAPLVSERAAPLVRRLRAARPDTPIVLIEDRTYTNAWIVPQRHEDNETRRAAQRAAYRQLLDEGVEGLHYIRGESLVGDDDEATVDSSHPTDLGFARYADAIEPIVAPLVG